MNKQMVGIPKVIYIFIISLFLFITNSFGQNITKTIRVVSGGSVPLNFNSITEYTNGKTLNSWTRLAVKFADTTGTGGDGASTGWVVKVRAASSVIQADGASPDLALTHIELRPITIIPGTSVNNIILTDADLIIVNGGDPGVLTTSGEIIINYDCGITNPLLGKLPDYYFVDLVFTIEEVP